MALISYLLIFGKKSSTRSIDRNNVFFFIHEKTESQVWIREMVSETLPRQDEKRNGFLGEYLIQTFGD